MILGRPAGPSCSMPRKGTCKAQCISSGSCAAAVCEQSRRRTIRAASKCAFTLLIKPKKPLGTAKHQRARPRALSNGSCAETFYSACIVEGKSHKASKIQLDTHGGGKTRQEALIRRESKVVLVCQLAHVIPLGHFSCTSSAQADKSTAEINRNVLPATKMCCAICRHKLMSCT